MTKIQNPKQCFDLPVKSLQAVIASEAKQSLSIQVSEIMGLLRHFVPRNDRR
jgi:hypothetical protein